MNRSVLNPHTGTNGGQATARKHAILIDGKPWTKRGVARHLGLADSTVRKRIRIVWQMGERLTLAGIAGAKR